MLDGSAFYDFESTSQCQRVLTGRAKLRVTSTVTHVVQETAASLALICLWVHARREGLLGISLLALVDENTALGSREKNTVVFKCTSMAFARQKEDVGDRLSREILTRVTSAPLEQDSRKEGAAPLTTVYTHAHQ